MSVDESYFLNLDKPVGWTSFDVVKKVRGLLQIKRVGHLGTLDPFANGVLPLAFGKATKLIQYLQADQKEYIVEFKLGQNSSTCDLDGELTDIDLNAEIKLSQIEAELINYQGEIQQIPPKMSAIKINGKRAYALARAGKDFELKPRTVRIDEVNIVAYKWPILKLRILCGKGFYVRSLGRDLGANLKVGAHAISLRRTKVGFFTEDNLVTIPALEQGSTDFAKISILEAWGDRPKYNLQQDEWSDLSQGKFAKSNQVISEGTLGILDGEVMCLLENVKGSAGMMKVASQL